MNTTSNLGSKLKNTRESLRLTIKEVSERLRINPRFLTMLEDENFKQALPATFMRGYLRCYAQLLNFTENEINEAVKQLNTLIPDLQLEKTSSGLTIPKNTKKDKWHRILSYMVIFTLILLVSMWWKSHSTNVRNMKMVLQPPITPPSLVQPPPANPTAVVPPKMEQTTSSTPQAPLKTAQTSNQIKITMPEEPGLDLSDEE